VTRERAEIVSLRGRFPVVALSFKDVKEKSYAHAVAST
jgi:hypothetical protein